MMVLITMLSLDYLGRIVKAVSNHFYSIKADFELIGMETDQTLRETVLKGYYAKRKQGFVPANSQGLESNLATSEILRVSEQLHELGLIEFKPLRGDDRIVSAFGRVTARGIDFIEQGDSEVKRRTKMTEHSSNSNLQQIPVEVLLITVTRVEASAVLALLSEKYDREPIRYFADHKTYYDLGVIGGARVFMMRSEMGSGGASGSTTTTLEGIKQLSPSAVIMVGIAFGVDPEDQSIGDVLVSRQLMEYELQRISTSKENKAVIKPRGDRVSASPRLLDRFRDGEIGWDGANLLFGLVLSGGKLVDNLNFRNQLLELEPEAVGGEMEGAGLYAAAHLQKVDWILVKAICDWADGHKSENKDQNQALAARNAADFVFHVLEQGGLANQQSGDTRLSPERIVDVNTRLAYYKMTDADVSPRGGTVVIDPLVTLQHIQGADFKFVVADSSTSFLVVPSHPFEIDSSVLFQTARSLFTPNRWYDVRQPGPRYYAARIFPLQQVVVRSEQNAFVLEDRVRGMDGLIFILRVNENGEIYFTTSYYTVDNSQGSRRIFKLGGIIHLLWSFLCLVKELCDAVKYDGKVHVFAAVNNTKGAFLGDFVSGDWPDPCKPNYLRGPELFGEICRNNNILIRRENVDLSLLESKVEPEIIRSVAEELARAFNQAEARCFDVNGRIPGNLWPIRD